MRLIVTKPESKDGYLVAVAGSEGSISEKTPEILNEIIKSEDVICKPASNDSKKKLSQLLYTPEKIIYGPILMYSKGGYIGIEDLVEPTDRSSYRGRHRRIGIIKSLKPFKVIIDGEVTTI